MDFTPVEVGTFIKNDIAPAFMPGTSNQQKVLPVRATSVARSQVFTYDLQVILRLAPLKELAVNEPQYHCHAERSSASS